MKSKLCTYLPESAAAYLPTSSWATRQLSLLSGNHTPAESCENEPPKDGSPACMCGKGTLGCSIHPSTPELWTASMRASLAKTLALLESRQVYLREPDQVFTAKSSESLAWFDRDSCSWKTYQQSFLTDSEPYLETWPRWGMTQGGAAYAHPMSERRITETGGFFSESFPTPTKGMAVHSGLTPETQIREYNRSMKVRGGASSLAVYIQQPYALMVWLTPRTSDTQAGRLMNQNGQRTNKAGSMTFGANLSDAVKFWPTPRASEYKGSGPVGSKSHKHMSERDYLCAVVLTPDGGQLNPDWVGWLMGFPIAWANSKATAMPKFPSKPQQHGDCSGESDAP